MPELPDVEGFRRVAERAAGGTVEEVEVHDPGVVRNLSARELRQALVGSRVERVYRHGKWLLVATDGGSGSPQTLLLHFGMTGMLLWCEPGTDLHQHDRVVFRFDDGELRYRDMRKLTGIQLLSNESEVNEFLDSIGPDAAAISRAEFGDLVLGARRQLKPLLMDQSVLAGLGNICVDEILWQAHLHPKRSDISADDLDELYRTMRSVLRTSMRAGQVPPRESWLTGHRDRSGEPCPRCGQEFSRKRIGGRTTVWCPKCQPD